MKKIILTTLGVCAIISIALAYEHRGTAFIYEGQLACTGFMYICFTDENPDNKEFIPGNKYKIITSDGPVYAVIYSHEETDNKFNIVIQGEEDDFEEIIE